jgi:predicted small lipoprotein YifL
MCVLPFATMFRLLSLLAPAIAALLIQGCGYKGPLELPPEQPARKQQAAPAP